MEEDLISIIVPVYNLENYIEKCIKSLINQTYNKIEIILIDDGSTDNSFYIMEKYSKIDKRIHLIHKKNEGVSKARNVGLKVSNGKYLCFVDGDDTVDKNYINFLYKSLKKNNADIAICGHKDIKNGKVIFETKDLEANVNAESAIRMLLETNYFFSTCWAKMFKKQLFEGIYFDENLQIGEDLDVLYKIFYKAESFYINTKEKYYNTLIRDNSASRNGYNPNWKKMINLLENIISSKDSKYYNFIKKYAIKRYMRINFTCIKLIILHEDKKNYEEVKYFIENIKKYVNKKDYKLNKKEKLILIVANNPILRKLYKNLKN